MLNERATKQRAHVFSTLASRINKIIDQTGGERRKLKTGRRSHPNFAHVNVISSPIPHLKQPRSFNHTPFLINVSQKDFFFFLKGIQLSPGHDTRSCSNRKNKTPPSLPGQVPSPSEGLAVVDEGGGRRGGGCGVKKAESPIMRRVLALKLVAEDRRSFVRSARNEACPSSMKRKSRAG